MNYILAREVYLLNEKANQSLLCERYYSMKQV